MMAHGVAQLVGLCVCAYISHPSGLPGLICDPNMFKATVSSVR